MGIATTFTEMIANPESEKIFLAEIQLAQFLSGWTLTDGQTYTYEIPFLFETVTFADDTTENLRKEIVKFEEDGTELTEKTSIATVEANSGSWWHDTANAKLYVHTSGSNHPKNYTMIGFFWVYFATKGIQLNEKYYEPYIAKKGVPSLTVKNNNIHWGVSNIGLGSLKFINNSGYFDQISKRFIWTNKLTRLLLGGDDLPYSEYEVLFTGRIRDKKFTGRSYALKLKSMAFDLLRKLPINDFWISNYPDLEESAEGSSIPYYYGSYNAAQAPIVTCIDIAYAENTYQFKICDHAIKSITQVYVDYDDGNGWQTINHGNENLINATFTIVSADFVVGTSKVKVSLEGKYSVFDDYIAGFWKFDEGTGSSAKDSSGNGNNGTLVAMEEADWINGVSGKALNFDGIDEYVTTTATFKFFKIDSFSISFWINFQDHSARPVAAAGLVGKGHYYPNTWDFYLMNTNQIRFEVAGEVLGEASITSAVLDINVWHHIVGVYDNTSMKLYINAGTPITQTYPGTGDFDNNNNVYFAARQDDASRRLIGKLDEIRIYNRALTSVEVSTLYHNPALLETPPCIVEDLLLNFCGYGSGDLNSASFTVSKTRTEMIVNVPIEKEIRTLKIIEKLCASDLAFFDEDGEGKLRYRTWEPEIGDPPLLDGKDILIRPIPSTIDDITSLFWKIKVGYSYLSSQDKYLYNVEDNEVSRYKYEKEETLTHKTYLRGQSDASRLGQRLLLVLQDPSPLLSIKLKAIQILKTLGDKIKVSLKRASIEAAGGYDKRPFEIFYITKSFFPLQVKLKCRDLPDYSSNIGFWTIDATPDWDSATEEEKTSAGFWTDDDGYADSSDEDSLHKSRWW